MQPLEQPAVCWAWSSPRSRLLHGRDAAGIRVEQLACRWKAVETASAKTDDDKQKSCDLHWEIKNGDRGLRAVWAEEKLSREKQTDFIFFLSSDCWLISLCSLLLFSVVEFLTICWKLCDTFGQKPKNSWEWTDIAVLISLRLILILRMVCGLWSLLWQAGFTF